MPKTEKSEPKSNQNYKITKMRGVAFLAFPEMQEILRTELEERLQIKNRPTEIYGNLLYYADVSREDLMSMKKLPYFSQCTLFSPIQIDFESIGTAAQSLKSIQRSWAPYQYQFFRRAELIQEKLPYINLKERDFPTKIPSSPIGIYTLINEKKIIASAETSSFLPAGKIVFKEDHINPPSRAYLKLQESLTMANLLNGTPLPKPGDFCFEAGACPGGWTWVLLNLGASVLAVDRSELDSRLMKNPLVTFKAHDAFTILPEEIGKCDWVFSDVICYPERLLKWINRWIESGLVKNMICTIKMQGKTDWSIIEEFEKIPGSKVIHLNYNKHELTWIHTEKES